MSRPGVLTFTMTRAEYEAVRFALTYLNLSQHQIAFATGLHIDAIRLVGGTPGLMRERADYVEEASLEIRDHIRKGDNKSVVVVGRDIDL